APFIPAPKDCCFRCYVTEAPVRDFKLLNDKFFNGQKKEALIGFVEDNGLRYQEKYFLIASLRSISEDGHNFFEIIRQQLDLSGDVFDPPPATVNGNIFNINTPDEPVIGFFSVSDIKKDSIYIQRNILEVNQPDLLIKDDCRLTEGATTQEPTFWQ
ncbi:MAG: DUF4249 family protein, partial [Fulvivirga sp.]|nr:DUF4249 family protein [Fulvivirga sp.]